MKRRLKSFGDNPSCYLSQTESFVAVYIVEDPSDILKILLITVINLLPHKLRSRLSQSPETTAKMVDV